MAADPDPHPIPHQNLKQVLYKRNQLIFQTKTPLQSNLAACSVKKTMKIRLRRSKVHLNSMDILRRILQCNQSPLWVWTKVWLTKVKQKSYQKVFLALEIHQRHQVQTLVFSKEQIMMKSKVWFSYSQLRRKILRSQFQRNQRVKKKTEVCSVINQPVAASIKDQMRLQQVRACLVEHPLKQNLWRIWTS